jgi:hypothetical protein
VELRALAHALQRHIIVFTVGLPPVSMGEEFEGVPRVCVFFWGGGARTDRLMTEEILLLSHVNFFANLPAVLQPQNFTSFVKMLTKFQSQPKN